MLVFPPLAHLGPNGSLILTTVDRSAALQAKTAAEPDAHLHSILDKAFKGEL